MAAVTDTKTEARRIDNSLRVAFSQWKRVQWYAQEWANLDAEQQLSFIEEWGLVTSRLKKLADAASSGRMNERQRSRYTDLLNIVAMHKAAAERLLAS